MMKAWIENGLRVCPEAEFFVLDHGSTPDLSDMLSEFIVDRGVKVNFTKIPPVPFDDEFKAMALTSFAKILLQCFEIVVTTDCDELLVGLGLRDSEVLEKLRAIEGIAAPIGFEIVHHIAREQPFNSLKPIELQRAYGFLTSAYTKPVIWKKRSEFGPGLHSVRDDFSYEPTLGLLHLRSVDAAVSDQRAEDRRGYTLSAGQVDSGRGRHWGRTAGQRADFFARLDSTQSIPAYQDEFPAFYRNVVEDHKKNGGGFYGHNIRLTSGYCNIGELLYVQSDVPEKIAT